AFWYSGLEHFVRWKPRPFHVEVDGERHTATFAAFGRVSRYGGNLLITPRARLDQPEFEICLVHSINRLRYLRLLPAAMFGGLSETMKEVSFFRASSARVTGEGVLAQLDGELFGELPMSLAVTPHSIEVVTY